MAVSVCCGNADNCVFCTVAVTAIQDNFIHNEEYIFTTEAHPLHIAAVQAGGFDKLHKNLKHSAAASTQHTARKAEQQTATVTGATASVTARKSTSSGAVYSSDNVCGPVAVTLVVQDVAVVADDRYAATCVRRDALYMVSPS
jgi:hypothetical protein